MSADLIAERTAEILALARGVPRVAALPKRERIEWARGQAERELANVDWLPGRLAWSQIERGYRELASSEARPGRRRRKGQPSRPELAAWLAVSPATLDRACIAAGRGKHWPPRGLTS